MAAGDVSVHDNSTTAPLHVLHVADADSRARCGPVLAEALRALCVPGHRVSLLTSDAELAADLAATTVEVLRVSQLEGWGARHLGEHVDDELSPPPALVHVWGTAGFAPLAAWARAEELPVLIHVLGAGHVDRLIHRGLRPNEHVIFVSDTLAAGLLRRLPQIAGRCRTILPAVPSSAPSAPVGEATRTLSVLCVSPFEERCGLDVLIDAVAQLRRNRYDLQVALIGAGPAAAALWRQIRARTVHDCVSLINEPLLWTKALPEIDVCVVPARQRELWLAPLVAMGRGKVVIAARDQQPEWFVEDASAWQFTPGSAVELAYLMARVVDQPRQAAVLGAAAAEYARTHHAMDAFVARLTEFYDALCGPGAARPAARPGELG